LDVPTLECEVERLERLDIGELAKRRPEGDVLLLDQKGKVQVISGVLGFPAYS